MSIYFCWCYWHLHECNICTSCSYKSANIQLQFHSFFSLHNTVSFSWALHTISQSLQSRQAAVFDKCCYMAHMFSMEVWAHHTAAPWPLLATDAVADRVQAHCACFPLLALYGSTMPCIRTVPCSCWFCFSNFVWYAFERQVSECDFGMNAFKLRNDFDIVG